MYKILIVEDDDAIARVLCEHLTRWGYHAQPVTDFEHVLDAFSQLRPHLVLLDISLPFFNGFHWCAQLRRRSQVPILFLSSADDHMNTVMAMQMGGDDFIAKPFDLTVLTVKIRALLRRAYEFSTASEVLECDGLLLNVGDASASYRERSIDLTRNEYKIIKLLMERKGTVVARDEIMKALWASDSFVDENTLTVNINRLRRKLSAAGLADFIHTKKGAGYLVG